MRPLESMRMRLQETGLYALSGGTAADWELEAYAAGLELLYAAVVELAQNAFPETAAAEGLSLWEGLLRAAESMGVPVSAAEEPGRICCMTAGTPDGEELSRFRRSIGGFVPAHLKLILDSRPLSWDAVEEKGYSWQQMDSASMTWRDIDSLGGGMEEIPAK